MPAEEAGLHPALIAALISAGVTLFVGPLTAAFVTRRANGKARTADLTLRLYERYAAILPDLAVIVSAMRDQNLTPETYEKYLHTRKILLLEEVGALVKHKRLDDALVKELFRQPVKKDVVPWLEEKTDGYKIDIKLGEQRRERFKILGRTVGVQLQFPAVGAAE